MTEELDTVAAVEHSTSFSCSFYTKETDCSFAHSSSVVGCRSRTSSRTFPSSKSATSVRTRRARSARGDFRCRRTKAAGRSEWTPEDVAIISVSKRFLFGPRGRRDTVQYNTEIQVQNQFVTRRLVQAKKLESECLSCQKILLVVVFWILNNIVSSHHCHIFSTRIICQSKLSSGLWILYVCYSLRWKKVSLRSVDGIVYR